MEFSRVIRKETLPLLSWDLSNLTRDVISSRVSTDDWRGREASERDVT